MGETSWEMKELMPGLIEYLLSVEEGQAQEFNKKSKKNIAILKEWLEEKMCNKEKQEVEEALNKAKIFLAKRIKKYRDFLKYIEKTIDLDKKTLRDIMECLQVINMMKEDKCKKIRKKN